MAVGEHHSTLLRAGPCSSPQRFHVWRTVWIGRVRVVHRVQQHEMKNSEKFMILTSAVAKPSSSLTAAEIRWQLFSTSLHTEFLMKQPIIEWESFTLLGRHKGITSSLTSQTRWLLPYSCQLNLNQTEMYCAKDRRHTSTPSGPRIRRPELVTARLISGARLL